MDSSFGIGLIIGVFSGTLIGIILMQCIGCLYWHFIFVDKVQSIKNMFLRPETAISGNDGKDLFMQGLAAAIPMMVRTPSFPQKKFQKTRT